MLNSVEVINEVISAKLAQYTLSLLYGLTCLTLAHRRRVHRTEKSTISEMASEQTTTTKIKMFKPLALVSHTAASLVQPSENRLRL